MHLDAGGAGILDELPELLPQLRWLRTDKANAISQIAFGYREQATTINLVTSHVLISVKDIAEYFGKKEHAPALAHLTVFHRHDECVAVDATHAQGRRRAQGDVLGPRDHAAPG